MGEVIKPETVGCFCIRNDYKGYLVTEFMAKGSVHDLLKKENLSWPQKIKIAFEVLSALCYLHSQFIAHGDIKGPNILVDENYNVKLADLETIDIEGRV